MEDLEFGDFLCSLGLEGPRWRIRLDPSRGIQDSLRRVYIHMGIYTYIHACIHTCMHTYIHLYIYIYIHILYIYIHVHVSVYVYVFK